MSTSAAPLYLNTAAWPGMRMRRQIGYGYSRFLFRYQNGIGDMNYASADFRRLWKTILRHVERNPNYVARVRQRYHRTFQRHEREFAALTVSQLRKLNNQQLLSALRRCLQTMVDSVRIAHLCDTVSVQGEIEFNQLLTRELSDVPRTAMLKLQLTASPKESFIQREERELRAINQLQGRKRVEALTRHSKNYHWYRNTYAGPQPASFKFFARRLASLPKSKPKQRPIKIRALPNRVIRLGRVIGFVTALQDERKENILKAIGFLGFTVQEVARRMRIPVTLPQYLTITDLRNIKDINDLKKLRSELKSRSHGCLILTKPSGETVVSGRTYRRLHKIYQRSVTPLAEKTAELRGHVAQPGLVIGPVRICLRPSEMKRVRAGDILVTSMTRPELLPAIRRAAAIVTDEGGITSHAAILARELQIPCIIGTKIATKVLKDGDRVEVDATNGTVRKL